MAVTDHPLKRLVALAAVDFAGWLLDATIQHVETRTIQLTANPEPIDADQVLLPMDVRHCCTSSFKAPAVINRCLCACSTT
ncbi:MAG: hypothetical protein MI924_29915 [Chloroflexales bacterium]|nr:hypothetical protein [Chloroflexales bacterium]